jgi:putative ABC transport system permease protein
VALGLGLGLIVALWVTRLLQQQLFSIGPTDPTTYVGVAACFVMVGVLACLLPAMRAVRINPVEAFRGE